MTWEPRNRVEDEDNNNEDDDSGRKSVDEKDRLGEFFYVQSSRMVTLQFHCIVLIFFKLQSFQELVSKNV